jgi:hypothetical protein
MSGQIHNLASTISGEGKGKLTPKQAYVALRGPGG